MEKVNKMEQRFMETWERKISNMSNDETLSLYIDFPFCRNCCSYCIYKSLTYRKNIKYVPRYKDAIIKLLNKFAPLFKIKTPDTLYFGGGTASLWSLDDLREIKNAINGYNKIKFKKTEAHPVDLTDDRVHFYKEEMQINVISVGIQSFDKLSNKGQKRIYVPINTVKHIVQLCQTLGMYVNIDLVALFNGDTADDWDIFKKDMEIACKEIKPDSIVTLPNYRTTLNYTSQVMQLRKIIDRFCKSPYSYIASDSVLSQDPDIVLKHGTGDHILFTPSFLAYCNKGNYHLCSLPGARRPGQNTLAFGGAKDHLVYSFTSSGNVFYSRYNFDGQKFDWFAS